MRWPASKVRAVGPGLAEAGLVLRAVETALVRNLRDDDLSSFLAKSCAQVGLVLHGNEFALRNPREADAERRRDHLSHFILRLAFCGNPENIRWLVSHETILLRTRFERSSGSDKGGFLNRSTTGCRVASPGEKRALSQQLAAVHGSDAEDFYAVPFDVVPDLVGRRGVFIRSGVAYVPKSEAFSIVMSQFREQLEAQMERTAKELPSLRDDRLVPLLELVKRADSTAGAGEASKGFIEGHLTAEDVDKVEGPRRGSAVFCVGFGAFPAVHAAPAQEAAPRLAPQVRRPPAVRPLPQVGRADAGGCAGLLAPLLLQQGDRRQVSEGVRLQCPPQLRAGGQACQLCAVQVSPAASPAA